MPGGSAGVDGSAALQGPAQGELVGVLEVAADRQAAGDPGEADAVGGQVAGHEGGRGLALKVRVGGDYHLFHVLGLDLVTQLGHPDLSVQVNLFGQDVEHKFLQQHLASYLNRGDLPLGSPTGSPAQ